MATLEAHGAQVENDAAGLDYKPDGFPEAEGAQVETSFDPVLYRPDLFPAAIGCFVEFPDFPIETSKNRIFIAGVKQNVFTGGDKTGAPLRFK